MENFIFSVNVTIPIFLVMVLGWFLRQIGMLDEHFVTVANRFNFKVTLPFMLFRDISGVDILRHDKVHWRARNRLRLPEREMRETERSVRSSRRPKTGDIWFCRSRCGVVQPVEENTTYGKIAAERLLSL